MASNIDKRLQQLRLRRGGVDRLAQLNEAARDEVIRKSVIEEEWQKKAKNKPHTQYALGAMQEVDSEYTRISVETAERVGKQLYAGLTSMGFLIDFRLQGSVPLNVHIRGVSDVDLLNIDVSFITYDRTGALSLSGNYNSPTPKTSVGELLSLRKESEKILISQYPAATVDTSGGKAIAISGGSLARPVDVVPSHWHDTVEYQNSRNEHDRGVTILNKKVPETIDNQPFLHIHRINQRDQQTIGGLKKAIRLCKNVKNDAIEDGRSINLPSFDIAATMYHADIVSLQRGIYFDLAILAETQRFLDELYHNPTKAKSLIVPDGSRRIFDTEDKYNALKTLSMEMDNLAREVAKEQNALLGLMQELTFSDVRNELGKASIY